MSKIATFTNKVVAAKPPASSKISLMPEQAKDFDKCKALIKKLGVKATAKLQKDGYKVIVYVTFQQKTTTVEDAFKLIDGMHEIGRRNMSRVKAIELGEFQIKLQDF